MAHWDDPAARLAHDFKLSSVSTMSSREEEIF